MKILTLGNSPYLLTASSQYHAELLRLCSQNGNKVSAIIYGAKYLWEKPLNDKYYFWQNGSNIAEIRHLLPIPVSQNIGPIKKIINEQKPGIVISIGDLDKVKAIYECRFTSDCDFHWIHIWLPPGTTLYDGDAFYFKYVDCIIATTQGTRDFLSHALPHSEIRYIAFGPEDTFYRDNLRSTGREQIRIINCSFNSAIANIGNFLEACTQLKNKTKIYLHTNLAEKGYVDIENILSLSPSDIIRFPEKFVSTSEGISVEELANEYGNADVVIDCSCESDTALSVLEGMAGGCIPLCSNVGALKEIINEFPDKELISLEGTMVYYTEGRRIMVVSPEEICRKIIKLDEVRKSQKDLFKELSIHSRIVAEKFNRKNWRNKVKETIEYASNLRYRLIAEEI